MYEHDGGRSSTWGWGADCSLPQTTVEPPPSSEGGRRAALKPQKVLKAEGLPLCRSSSKMESAPSGQGNLSDDCLVPYLARPGVEEMRG